MYGPRAYGRLIGFEQGYGTGPSAAADPFFGAFFGAEWENCSGSSTVVTEKMCPGLEFVGEGWASNTGVQVITTILDPSSSLGASWFFIWRARLFSRESARRKIRGKGWRLKIMSLVINDMRMNG